MVTKNKKVEKGQSPSWKVGRKPTGRVRDKNLTIKLTNEEREFVREKLKEIDEKSFSIAILKLLNYEKK